MDSVADALDADHHSRELHDLEHLRDAVVSVSDQPADGGDAVLAERQLAGGGCGQTHLVFKAGGENTVALAGLAGVRVRQILRNDKHA